MSVSQNPTVNDAKRKSEEISFAVLPGDYQKEDFAEPMPVVPRPLKRKNAVAGKGPMMYQMVDDLEEDDSEEAVARVLTYMDTPNLFEYFAEFEITVEDQIKICRGFANLQSATLRAVSGASRLDQQ